MDRLAQLDKQYLWHPFTPMKLWLEDEPVVIDRGEGVYLIDTQGNRYIDGVSSLWCNVHGHNHPVINSHITRQLEKISHSTLLGLASGPSIELAEKLANLAPEGLNRVFYSDAGATSVEIGIKIAFQYWRIKGQSRRQKFVALKQSYHGDTMGSVSIGGIETFHKIFGPMTFAALFAESPHPYRYSGTVDECRESALADMRRILEEHGNEVAAIVVEPLVQGAAGLIVHPAGYLAGVRKLADEFGVLLVVDEVATGFGKTGTIFAHEREGVKPDIFCVAKGLTGGYLPLAATIVSDEVFEPFTGEPLSDTTFYHGHTYTGNALACAAALGCLEVFEKENTLAGLGERISLIEKYLEKMKGFNNVGNVRHCGLMAGVELVEDKDTQANFDSGMRLGANICQVLRSKGVMMRPLGDVLVIMPPLAIPVEVLDDMLETVCEVVSSYFA